MAFELTLKTLCNKKSVKIFFFKIQLMGEQNAKTELGICDILKWK